MIEALKKKLRVAVDFPSPPAVAQEIISLASDPEIDVVKVAAVIGKDPGLTVAPLRPSLLFNDGNLLIPDWV